MNPEAKKCLSEIDALIESVKRLRKMAVKDLDKVDGTDQVEVDNVVRRLRWQLADLVGRAAVPGKLFLVRESLYQLKLKPRRRNFAVLECLDDIRLLDMCYRLLTGSEHAEHIGRQYTDVQVQNGLPVWGRSSFHRFTVALRKQYKKVQAHYSGGVATRPASGQSPQT